MVSKVGQAKIAHQNTSATLGFTYRSAPWGAQYMFDFFGLGRSKSDAGTQTAQSTPVPRTGLPSATQREMVRLTLHNVLKRHGIPVHWISGEIAPVYIPQHGESLLLQLVVLKWHDALMLYAPALQQELLDGLKRFDPSADASKYLFAWGFAPQCGCPHATLPEPAFWSAATIAVTATLTSTPLEPAPTLESPKAKPKFDLPPTAADRKGDSDSGFASTQINDFQ
jgi:hypothetical protein